MFQKFTNEKLSTVLLYLLDIILDRPNLKNGLLIVPPKKIDKDGDFIHIPGVLGFVSKDILRPDGNYKEFRPTGEQQNVGSEKMHCVPESACNTIETRVNYYLHLIDNGKATPEQIETVNIFRHFGLIKTVDGKERCLVSTRYVAAGSGTTIRGNTQKAVADFIRHYGLVPKDEYPYVNDWNEYYYPSNGVPINGNKVPQDLLNKGQKLVEYIEFNYEWIYPNYIGDTYQYGPLQNIGFAWEAIENGIYQRSDNSANHAFMGDGRQETYHQVFDSYDPFDKKVALNFYKNYAMIYTMKPLQALTSYNFDYLKRLMSRGLEYVLLVNKFEGYDTGVYKLYADRIEKDSLKVVLDAGVKKLAADKKLTGISVEDFKKLINLA